MTAKPTSEPAPILTTAGGNPVADNQNSLTAGPRGPVLLADFSLVEKMAHFNRERIPERVVHAKGSAAYGTLTITKDVSRYTHAKLFSAVGKKTDLLLRFSTVAGERGAADAERDVRGFAIKFYTEEGNWDLVGNNTPVFFVRDPLKFSDFIHTQKRDPQTNLRSATAMWDFWSLSPESLHQVTILFSDRGLPKNYRQMHGFGSHTYSFINAANERFWVKFHFKSMQGIANLTNAEAAGLVGDDRETHQRDLFQAIERGDYPKWRFSVQIMPEKEAETYHLNPFDEGVAAQGLPVDRGRHSRAEPQPRELLRRGRAGGVRALEHRAGHRPFAGQDAAGPDLLLCRCAPLSPGVNHDSLPVNRPRCPVHTYHRDGLMRADGNGGGAVNYEPNSFSGPQQSAAYREPPLRISGDADRYDHRAGNDDYGQPGALFRLMSPAQRDQLLDNLAAAMTGVPEAIHSCARSATSSRPIRPMATASPPGSALADKVGRGTPAAAE